MHASYAVCRPREYIPGMLQPKVEAKHSDVGRVAVAILEMVEAKPIFGSVFPFFPLGGRVIMKITSLTRSFKVEYLTNCLRDEACRWPSSVTPICRW